MRFPPFRERHRRDNVGGLEEENDKKTVVVILEVFLSLSFTVVYCAEFCGVSCWNNNNVSVSRLLCTYVLGRQREKKSGCFSSKRAFNLDSIRLCIRCSRGEGGYISAFCCFFFRVERFVAEELLVKIYSAHKEKRARSIGYSTTRSWNTITRARNASFDYIRARIFRRRRQRNRETGSFKRERHIPTRIKSEKIIRVGHFLARKYLLSVRPRGPRTSRQQAQCIKKYISIPKKNLEKDLYVRACARASKKTKTKRTHI